MRFGGKLNSFGFAAVKRDRCTYLLPNGQLTFPLVFHQTHLQPERPWQHLKRVTVDGMNSSAKRLPNVIVPVLSNTKVLTSPQASTARPEVA